MLNGDWVMRMVTTHPGLSFTWLAMCYVWIGWNLYATRRRAR